MKFSATTIFLVLMAVAACMMMAALISTSEHQARYAFGAIPGHFQCVEQRYYHKYFQ